MLQKDLSIDGTNPVNPYRFRVLTWNDPQTYWKELGEFIQFYGAWIRSFHIVQSEAIKVVVLLDSTIGIDTAEELDEKIKAFTQATINGPTTVIAIAPALDTDPDAVKQMLNGESLVEWPFYLAVKRQAIIVDSEA